jgi:copper resistance protein C
LLPQGPLLAPKARDAAWRQEIHAPRFEDAIMRPIVLSTALALFASTPAFAHAHLDSSAPTADAKLVEPPAEITLDFSEEIEPMFSAIEVEDDKGARVDKGDVHTAPDDAKRLVVSIDARASGVYKVTWRVTSTDTHKSKGSFNFTVGK